MKHALEKKGLAYEVNEGDGAFYGPKIDFKLKDAIGRTWQCATIQLDFNLPERFEIKYQEKDGSMQTPVMIHRVIFGSMERFVGVLIEHYAGAFPAWLAPQQVTVIPISDRHTEYAETVYQKLKDLGIRVKIDDRSESMNYKNNGKLRIINSLYACNGHTAIENSQVAVRARTSGQIGIMSVDEFIQKLLNEVETKGKEVVSD